MDKLQSVASFFQIKILLQVNFSSLLFLSIVEGISKEELHMVCVNDPKNRSKLLYNCESFSTKTNENFNV